MPPLYLNCIACTVFVKNVPVGVFLLSLVCLTLQVLERERHDAPSSSSSHQALDVGCGQGENKALLPPQVSTCIEGDEDGLVHAGSCSRHHTAYCIGELLGH